MAKPTIPQGTRDFSSEVLRKRNFILNILKKIFECYGFQPLETPAMENLDTLMGKYGEEGDRLIFKILNNGLNDPKNADKSRLAFDQVMDGKMSKDLTERALKYDLTIPFARYVAMNHNLLAFPYKRYQIQPVWRADRPQKSRYREFTQCDADVVGSKSLINELELVNIYNEAFTQLSLPSVAIHINSRKLLSALARRCGGDSKLSIIAIAIDKLDKIGLDNVINELKTGGLANEQLDVIQQYLSIKGNNNEILDALEKLLGSDEVAIEGVKDLTYIINRSAVHQLAVDPTLARGLDYYTGAIFEIKPPPGINMGSLGGGGRYDDLTGLFGVPNIPGVGISFGIDRIYDVMEELNLFPNDLQQGASALFFNLGEKEEVAAMACMKVLRAQNISCEIFHESAKMDKQFKYAEKKNIPFVVIIGSRELELKQAVVKNLAQGKQDTLDWNDLPGYFSK